MGSDVLRLARDTRCQKCGYNLRTQPLNATCPECRHGVTDSMVADSKREPTLWEQEARFLSAQKEVALLAAIVALAIAIYALFPREWFAKESASRVVMLGWLSTTFTLSVFALWKEGVPRRKKSRNLLGWCARWTGGLIMLCMIYQGLLWAGLPYVPRLGTIHAQYPYPIFWIIAALAYLPSPVLAGRTFLIAGMMKLGWIVCVLLSLSLVLLSLPPYSVNREGNSLFQLSLTPHATGGVATMPLAWLYSDARIPRPTPSWARAVAASVHGVVGLIWLITWWRLRTRHRWAMLVAARQVNRWVRQQFECA